MGGELRRGRQLGIEQGLKEGIEQGIKQGIKQGREQGIKQGIKQGIEQGIERGIEQGRRALVIQMLENGMSPGDIMSAAGVSEDEIKAAQKENKHL